MAEMNSKDGLLPVYAYPMDRHYTKLRAGLHPTIDWDHERPFDVEETGGIVVRSHETDRLIGLLGPNNQCPVCGSRGSLNLVNNIAFVRGADDGDFSGGDVPQGRQSPLGKRLREGIWKAIVCEARSDPDDRQISSQSFFIGLANPHAVEGYHEWLASSGDRREVRSRSRALRSEARGAWPAEKALDGMYDHGDILAAIYDALGAESYDADDLAGRTNVTKTQLAAILDRVMALTFEERRDRDAEDWLYHRDFSIGTGRVQWHIPEWVDAEGLEWADSFRKRVFE